MRTPDNLTDNLIPLAAGAWRTLFVGGCKTFFHNVMAALAVELAKTFLCKDTDIALDTVILCGHI